MAKAVAQSYLVLLTELVVKSSGGQIEAVIVGKEPAIAFKLAVNVLVPGNLSSGQTRNRTHCKSARHESGTDRRRQVGRWARKAGDRRVTWQRRQSVDDGKLIVAAKLATVGPEDVRIRQQGNGVLRVTQETFKGTIEECLVLGDGETNCAAKLLARETV